MKSMGKERMTNPWFTWLHKEYGQGKDDYCLTPGLPGYMKSMGKERMTTPWFTLVHEEYGQGKDDCPLVYLGTLRVWARKGWLPPGFPGYMKSMGKERMTAPGLPGYMKSMGKERIVVPWFTWVHEEYDKGKDVCSLLYLVVTWRVWARKGCLSPGYMKSKIKERMSTPWFIWLYEE